MKPVSIYTDKWISYKSLIPSSIHNFTNYETNQIERINLNLRTHLKRLSRRTICYTKSVRMLYATLKLYFWGSHLSFLKLKKTSKLQCKLLIIRKPKLHTIL
ncbi:IS1 family transposase [Seonamhaeicola maritimus]|uniref:IS1 family transposase n=1 Tax=Seonamhaeicola maritimus TaxID=2591822 RepID=A0A5C7GFL4_9FLAO|nr:hypothetical protein FUA22_13975 [Seonamhaeicola maritimus]